MIVAGFTISCPAVKVCAGDGFSVALDAYGKVYTCGKGNFGRLCTGEIMSLSSMTKINWFGANKLIVKDIAAGGRHALVITETDTDDTLPEEAIYGWGFNFYY